MRNGTHKMDSNHSNLLQLREEDDDGANFSLKRPYKVPSTVLSERAAGSRLNFSFPL